MEYLSTAFAMDGAVKAEGESYGFACVCRARQKEQAHYCIRRLQEWLRTGLPTIYNAMGTVRGISGMTRGKRINKRSLEQELGSIHEEVLAHCEGALAGCICSGEECLIFRVGNAGGYLVNQFWGQPHTKPIFEETESFAIQVEAVCLQPDAALVFFTNGEAAKEAQAIWKKTLFPPGIRGQEKLQRRVRELGIYLQDNIACFLYRE